MALRDSPDENFLFFSLHFLLSSILLWPSQTRSSHESTPTSFSALVGSRGKCTTQAHVLIYARNRRCGSPRTFFGQNQIFKSLSVFAAHHLSQVLDFLSNVYVIKFSWEQIDDNSWRFWLCWISIRSYCFHAWKFRFSGNFENYKINKLQFTIFYNNTKQC